MVDNRKSIIQRTNQLIGEKDTMNLFVLSVKLDKSHKPLKMAHLCQSKCRPKSRRIISNVNIVIVILTNFPRKDTFHCNIRQTTFFFIRTFIFSCETQHKRKQMHSTVTATHNVHTPPRNNARPERGNYTEHQINSAPSKLVTRRPQKYHL